MFVSNCQWWRYGGGAGRIFFVGSSSVGKKQRLLGFLMGCDGDSTDFYFFIFLFWIYCDYASKRSVFWPDTKIDAVRTKLKQQ